ncbi:MAG TPA: acetylglutamate kinase [Ignavibacteriaceae bacterium]|nr:acetylglutamate kinase [Ignavibacteriaceae bacterium]
MKIALIKISGKTINEFITTGNWVKKLKKLKKIYDGIIIVHGAGQDITSWAEKMGFESKFINGQRVTTPELMDVAAAVQAGVINSKLNAKLNSAGFESSGFSGIDRGSFVAEYLNGKELGFVGTPYLASSVKWIIDLLEENVIPVFSSVCRDSHGNLMNVNADIFAGALAKAVFADTVFFFSDVEGVKINGKIKSFITEEEIENGILSGEINNGMIPKLKSCSALIKEGIKNIWIGSDLSDKAISQINKKYENGTWIGGTADKEYELYGAA